MTKIYKIKPSILSKYGIECPHCLWMGMNANIGETSFMEAIDQYRTAAAKRNKHLEALGSEE